MKVTITLTSEHPDAEKLVRRALENYAHMATVHAVQKRHRPLHPGETRPQLEKGAKVLDARAAAVTAMAEQIPGGQAGPSLP